MVPDGGVQGFLKTCFGHLLESLLIQTHGNRWFFCQYPGHADGFIHQFLPWNQLVYQPDVMTLPGIHRPAGWLLLAGSAATLLYFVLSMTGPILIAELVHHVLIVFLILGVFMIGLMLRRTAVAQ